MQSVASRVLHRVPAWRPSNQTMTWVFVVIGATLRLRQYLFDRSLWNDETQLVLNILHRSPADLLKPLNDYQVAPIGFLWVEKLSVYFLGSSEIALRLIPFSCGIGSVFLFATVARRFLRGRGVPIAVGLFAVSFPLIYYASEVKPYSSDVAVALPLYLVANALFKPNLKVAVLAALVGGVALWFSFPAVFVLVGTGLAAFCIGARRLNRSLLLLLCAVASVWASSFVIFYAISLHSNNNIPNLIEDWRAAYAPLPPTSVSDVLWYKKSFFEMFSFPGGLALTGIAGVAALMGANEVRRRNMSKFLILIMPIVAVVLASSLHHYPFRGRFILFMVPTLLLFVAEGLEAIRRTTWVLAPVLVELMIGFLFLDPVLIAARNFTRPEGVEEARSAIDYIESHRSSGDILYCYYPARFPLEYYRERGRIRPIEQITGIASREAWQAYMDDLNKLRGQKRVWILFSHVWRYSGVDEQALFLNHLDQIGRRLDGMQATGAAAFLYDLSGDGVPGQPNGI